MNAEEARKLQRQFEKENKRRFDAFVSNSYPEILRLIIQDVEEDIKKFANQGWEEMMYSIKSGFIYIPFITFLLKRFCKNKKEEAYAVDHIVEDLISHLEKEGFKASKCTYDEAETRIDLRISWGE